jgi:L-seryl-tRNA(Ser) seleniumtransferase
LSADSRAALLRQLPAVHRVLDHPGLEGMRKRFPHSLVAEAVSAAVDRLRQEILDGMEPADLSYEHIIRMAEDYVERLFQPNYRRVINATGVVLHTNLGRAPLPDLALRQILETAGAYSNLELNLATGERGSRYEHVENILCRLTGAEAAFVVNNNAAAVLLVLRELASGKKVIVSRGELVEIGGSFRVSEVMRESGAQLVEVGTTNKTHEEDYLRAIDGETAMIMKTHTSNFRIVGFTYSPPLGELVRIGHEHRLVVYEDLGSGVLLDLRKFGVGDEPTVMDSVAAGVDVVSFSGDKLLGGAQAGIIVGKREYIQRLRKNQLARALRVDKLTLAALEATLRLYLDESRARREIPALAMITKDADSLRAAAERLCDGLRRVFGDLARIDVVPGMSQVGGGSLPAVEIPTYLVAVASPHFSVARLEELLRQATIPVMARIQKEALLFDVRTIFPREIEECIAGCREAADRIRQC